MVSAMKGADDAVRLLLQFGASANLTDVHGTTALLEAVKNGHEEIVSLLKESGAELNMKESLAASVLCQAVFDGDILLLKRLLRAGIQVNAADYGKGVTFHLRLFCVSQVSYIAITHYESQLSFATSSFSKNIR